MLKLIKLPKNIFKYCVAAILIAVPLYPKFPFIRIPGTFVSVRLEDLLVAFAAFLIVVIYSSNKKILLENKFFRAFLVFICIGGFSLYNGIFITKTVTPHIGILHWLRRIEYFVPMFLGFEAVKKDLKSLEYYFKLVILIVFVIFVYGIGQRYLEWPIIITQNEEYSKGVALRWIPGSHINSTFAGHYDLGTFLVLVLPIVITAIFILKGFWTKLILLACSVSGLWLLVNSASRISLVSYLLAVSFSLILVKKYKAIPLVLIASIIFVGFSSNLLARYTRLIEVTMIKIKESQILNHDYLLNDSFAVSEEDLNLIRKKKIPTPSPMPPFEDRSTNIRLNVEWPRAIRGFSKNPLLGVGYSSISLATDNDFLRILGEIGILGFLAFFLIFFRIGEIFLTGFPLDKKFSGINLAIVSGLIGALPGIFLNAFFIDVFEASKFAIIFWLFIGLCISTLTHVKNVGNS